MFFHLLIKTEVFTAAQNNKFSNMYQTNPFKNSIITDSRNQNTSVDSLSTPIKSIPSEITLAQ